ncbi:hypothetical protein O6R16_03550 [Candidatus Rickettsia tasmanensis]
MTKKCNYSFSAEKNYNLISERKVSFEEIIYLVPFIIEVDGTVLLKTIIPRRKATQKYLKIGKSNEK